MADLQGGKDKKSPRRSTSTSQGGGSGGGKKAGAAKGKGKGNKDGKKAKKMKKERGGSDVKKFAPRRPGWDGLSMHERVAYVTFLVNVFHVSFFATRGFVGTCFAFCSFWCGCRTCCCCLFVPPPPPPPRTLRAQQRCVVTINPLLHPWLMCPPESDVSLSA